MCKLQDCGRPLSTILGLCKDSPDILRDLASYIEKWKVVMFQ